MITDDPEIDTRLLDACCLLPVVLLVLVGLVAWWIWR